MVECMYGPKKEAMDGPMDPVQTKIGNDEPQDYLDCARELMKITDCDIASEWEETQSISQERFPCLAGKDNHAKRQNVEGKIPAPVYFDSWSATLRDIEKKHNNEKHG